MADRLKFTEGGKDVLHPSDVRVEIAGDSDQIIIRHRFYAQPPRGPGPGSGWEA